MSNQTKHTKRKTLAALPAILVILLYAGLFARNVLSPNVSFSPDRKWIVALREPWFAWDPHSDVYYQPSWIPFLSHKITWLRRRARSHTQRFSWQESPYIVSVWDQDGRPFLVLDRNNGQRLSYFELLPLLQPPRGCPQHEDLLGYMISKNPYLGDYLVGAIRANDLARVKKLVEFHGADVNAPRAKVVGPRFSAKSIGLDTGPGPFDTRAFPLHAAVGAGNEEIVYYLLSKGARPGPLCKEAFPPLFSAVVRGDTNIVELLLNAGADINVALSSNGATVLLCAAEQGNLDMVKFLVQKGVRTDGSAPDGRTALSSARMFAEAHKNGQDGKGYAAVAAFLEQLEMNEKAQKQPNNQIDGDS